VTPTPRLTWMVRVIIPDTAMVPCEPNVLPQPSLCMSDSYAPTMLSAGARDGFMEVSMP
jgi:hypothetical protein